MIVLVTMYLRVCNTLRMLCVHAFEVMTFVFVCRTYCGRTEFRESWGHFQETKDNIDLICFWNLVKAWSRIRNRPCLSCLSYYIIRPIVNLTALKALQHRVIKLEQLPSDLSVWVGTRFCNKENELIDALSIIRVPTPCIKWFPQCNYLSI